MSRYNIVSTVFLVLMIGTLSIDGSFDIPLSWYIALIVIFILLTSIGSFVLSLQYFFPVKYNNTSSDSIAITFDDGPIEGNTENILNILKQFNVPAAFFCIGHRVNKNPEIIKEIHEGGHLIGNHSYWHKTTFPLQSSSVITKELYDTDNAIQKVIGKKPRFFRPPFGVSNPMIAKGVKRRNAVVIGWTVRSFDTVTPDPSKLFLRVTKTLKGGDIVLFHDYPEVTLRVLPQFLDYVTKLGLKVVRIDELLNERGYA